MTTRSRSRLTAPAVEYSDDEEEEENTNNSNNNTIENNNNNVKKSSLPKPHIPQKEFGLSVSAILSAAFAFSSVFYLIYTTMLLVYFLSGNASGILHQKHAWSDLSRVELIVQDLWILLLFVTQHTIMARDYFKHWMLHIIPEHIQRCLYIVCTGVAIQVLTSLWVNTLPDANLIIWDYSSSDPCRSVCQLLHMLSWIHTLAVVFMLDFSEFIGLKQVYYHINNFGCPMHAKTPEAQRFFRHFRHATASGLLTVFWAVPCMTLDRLLLASVFTVYLFSTNIDHEDEFYVRAMYKRKKEALH